MATDNLTLINIKINLPDIEKGNYLKIDFSNSNKIYQTLTQNHKAKEKQQTLIIYDLTYCPQQQQGRIFSVNDHINRIGNNPFIGQQNLFNIDFINVEKLYTQTNDGIVVTCFGGRYPQYKTKQPFSSTYLANLAALAHIKNYRVQGFLVNQI